MAGRIRIDSVVPDYYARYPKACMGGWGRQLMLINPAGKALPCHAAEVIPGLEFENVREQSLANSSGGSLLPSGIFAAKSGCRNRAAVATGAARTSAAAAARLSCSRRTPRATDPACSLAPAHAIVEAVLREANAGANVAKPAPASSFVQLQKQTADLWSYRSNPE